MSVLYVDPSCPLAWLTSRWLLEVSSLRDLPVELRLMSLSVVNEGRELEDWYRTFNDRAWLPARVGAGVQRSAGPDAFRRYYDAFGTRVHTGGAPKDLDAVRSALDDAGLDPSLVELAEVTDHDDELRATHEQVRALVGDDLGTPVLVVDGAAFFGPVVSSVVRGDEALALYEAVSFAAKAPAFAELKRGRGDLRFDG